MAYMPMIDIEWAFSLQVFSPTTLQSPRCIAFRGLLASKFCERKQTDPVLQGLATCPKFFYYDYPLTSLDARLADVD